MFTIRSSQRLVNASFLHSSSQRSFLPTNRDTALRRFLSYRVAIVGSGPSGCYTAKYIKSALDKKNIPDNTIDIIERLPTPYGLVRYGVAPDHPEVKNVQNDFDTLFEKGGIRFYGNVQVGRDVSVQELRQLYDVVVLAYGCESDRKLGIPGQDLDGVLSAREFVAWYNGMCIRISAISIRTNRLCGPHHDTLFCSLLYCRPSKLPAYRSTSRPRHWQ